MSFKNPRPFSDSVLRELSDPANIALLAAMDPNDGGLADIWSIQVNCGRRISEVIELRFDCVSEHLGRTWMWVDMTKVGKLDYAIQIPRDVYDLIVRPPGQDRGEVPADTRDRAHRRSSAARSRCSPARKTNPTFERSVSTSTFAVAFKAWIESEHISLARPHHPPGPPHPGHPAGPRGSQHDPRQTGPRARVGADERLLRAHRRLPGGAVPPAGVGHRTGQRHPGPDRDDPDRRRKGFAPNS